MPTLKITRGRYLQVLLAMCGLVASSIGVMTNTAGLFLSPIAAELGRETAAVNLTLTISNLMFAVAGVFSARWIGSRNLKPMLILFTALYALATAALALCRDLWPLYLLNAVRGFACGMVGSVLATTILGYWFHSDAGLISSLAMGCSGIIGALLNPVLEAVMTAADWRTAYLVSAGVVVLLNLPAILLPITFRPVDSGMEPLNAAASPKAGRPVRAERAVYSRSPAVMALAFCLCSLGSFISATPQLFKSMAVSRGLEETGVLMMTVVLIANTGGKFLFGAMTDRLGVKRSVLIYGTVIAAGLMLLYAFRAAETMLVSAAMIGLCYSIPTVGAVMVCRELFSPDRYTHVYPKIALSVSVCNALGYPILGAIYDRTQSYDPALLLLFALTLVTMATALAVYALAGREARKTAVKDEEKTGA